MASATLEEKLKWAGIAAQYSERLRNATIAYEVAYGECVAACLAQCCRTACRTERHADTGRVAGSNQKAQSVQCGLRDGLRNRNPRMASAGKMLLPNNQQTFYKRGKLCGSKTYLNHLMN